MTWTLEKIKELCSKATPGPWRWRQFGEHESLVADHGRRDTMLCDARTRNERGILVRAMAGMPNTEFIAASRTLMPRLLAVAEAAYAFDSYEPRDPARIALRKAIAALEADE